MPLHMKDWEFDPNEHATEAFSADVMREGFNVFNHLYDRLLALAVGTDSRMVALPNTQTGQIEQRPMSGIMIALQLAIFEALRYAEYNEGASKGLTVVTDPRVAAQVAAERRRREGD